MRAETRSWHNLQNNPRHCGHGGRHVRPPCSAATTSFPAPARTSSAESLPARAVPRLARQKQLHEVPPPAQSGAATVEQSDIFTESDWDMLIRGYTSQYVEHDFWVDDSMIEGQIPAELQGTFLRNGPGLFEIGGARISQPFDGDGMVSSFAFRNGRCFFRNRYVRTDAFMAEQEAGQMLFRGAFSVGNPSAGRSFNPLDLRIKPIANTNVLHWAGRTFALHERDLPWELDSQLRTLGRSKLGNSLGGAGTPSNFGSHVRTFREADGSWRLVGSTFEEGLTKGTLTFLELSEDMQLLHRTTAELPGAGFGFFHDMLVTEHYYIVLENPMRLDLCKMAFQYSLGRACLAECLKFDSSRPTKIHLIPRPGRPGGKRQQQSFQTDPFFCFHHVNAFEGADGAVIMDCLAMHAGVDFSINFSNLSSEFFQRGPWRTTLTRLTLDPTRGNEVRVSKLAPEQPWSLEMPNVAPASTGRSYRHAYMLGSSMAGPSYWGPPQDVVRVTLPEEATSTQQSTESSDALDARLERWSPGKHSFAQEPVFVPRSGRGGNETRGRGDEDDGWLLATVFRAASMTTDLVILDAADVAAGPIATLHLPLHIPIGLHGSFTDAYLGPGDERCPPRKHNIRDGVSRNGVPRYSVTE